MSSLCENYYWTLPQAMSLTLPQLLILNHAAYVNSERRKEKTDWDAEQKKKADEAQEKLDATDPVVFNGKRLSELTDRESAQYYSDI